MLQSSETISKYRELFNIILDCIMNISINFLCTWLLLFNPFLLIIITALILVAFYYCVKIQNKHLLIAVLILAGNIFLNIIPCLFFQLFLHNTFTPIIIAIIIISCLFGSISSSSKLLQKTRTSLSIEISFPVKSHTKNKVNTQQLQQLNQQLKQKAVQNQQIKQKATQLQQLRQKAATQFRQLRQKAVQNQQIKQKATHLRQLRQKAATQLQQLNQQIKQKIVQLQQLNQQIKQKATHLQQLNQQLSVRKQQRHSR